MKKFDTLLELLDSFPNEVECKKHIEALIWKGGQPVCPHCQNSKNIYRFNKRSIFKCSGCNKQFSLTTGTIFHGTHIPLRKWFVLIYLFTTHKKGVSAHQLAKDLKITVKTAWFMIHRLRAAIQSQDFGAQMKGTITVDESMWGQKSKNIHYNIRPKYNQGRKGDKKLKIFSMFEQEGRVKSVLVKNFGAATLQSLIYQHIEVGSTIQSDEYKGYNGLSYSYNHIRCDHGKHQYVAESGANTNKLENYFSGMKRTFHGTYHKMTAKHIQAYLSETDFRFNTRSETDYDRFNIALSLGRVRLSYKQLIQ